MPSQFKSDFGDTLLGAACLNPKTRDLVLGTNPLYTEWCDNVLYLNSIRQTSSASPYFESYQYNAGITFKSAQFPSYQALIYSYGDSMNLDIKSTNRTISNKS